MEKLITPQEVMALTQSDEEFALVDVREEGAFSENRLLLSSCLPLSRLELRVRALLPNPKTRVILMDRAGEGLAERARDRLAELGYRSLQIIAGGVKAWLDEGYSVYGGVNVMSKAFGEIVYEHCQTPDITPQTLKQWVDSGRKLVILDSRPFTEYHEHTIPGSISVPGAELAYRVHQLVQDRETTIVVNCAGRTRSIIGCQSLINAGVPNEVFCLRNGTMGWKLAGFELEKGATRTIASISPSVEEQAQRNVSGLAESFGIEFVDDQTLQSWRTNENRTVYSFDVRTPEEFAAGHLPFAMNAPGGQLVQATDDYVAVRNATLVLVDPQRIRAVMTASWLMQLGFSKVYVLDDPNAAAALGSSQIQEAVPAADIPQISSQELADRQNDGTDTLVLDVATSVRHKAAHIPGAHWTVRGRYEGIAENIGTTGEIVVTGDDTALMALTALELREKTGGTVRILTGGNTAWAEAGYPMEAGIVKAYSPFDDVWYKPFEYDDPEQEKEAANKYLHWEVQLTEKIKVDKVQFFPFGGASRL